jgi:hypothetical protein
VAAFRVSTIVQSCHYFMGNAPIDLAHGKASEFIQPKSRFVGLSAKKRVVLAFLIKKSKGTL